MHPDVAAMMGMGAGPPPSIQVDPSQHPAAGQGADSNTSFGDQIKSALDQIRAAISDGDASENEKLILEKMTTLGQQLLATHEKEHQAAMGGSPAMNFLRRASSGG